MHRGIVRGAGSLLMVCGTAAGLAAAATSTPAEAPPVVAPSPKPAPLRLGVFRFTSYPAAWTAAHESGRPILVYVTSKSCPHCTRMLGETYQRTPTRTFVTGSFETVLVDRTEQPELIQKLHVRLFPTTLVVGPDNQVLDVIEGYVDAAAFSRRLQTSLAAHAAGETQTR
jgi:thioredoxin-like negative regulator of GroEL